MKFHQFDQPRIGHSGEPMSALGQHLFEQAADVARAQASAVKEGVAIGQREGERYRKALCGIIAAYDRCVAVGPPIPQSIVHACEEAKKVLP